MFLKAKIVCGCVFVIGLDGVGGWMATAVFHKGNTNNTYEYIGGYWEAKEDGKWDNGWDIFGVV